jgi:hypothetical protein
MRDGAARAVRTGAALTALVVGCWIAALAVPPILAPLPSFVGSVEENFTNGQSVAGVISSVTGFEACPDGLCLRPHVTGAFEYRVPLPPGARGLRVRFWGQLPKPGRNRVSASADGGRTFAEVFHDAQHIGEATLDVPLAFDPATPPVIRIEATNRDVNLAMPLDKLEVLFLSAPVRPLPAVLPVAIMAAAFAGAFAMCARNPRRALATGALLVLAVVLRYAQFVLALNRPLDPDAQGYATFAERLHLFSDTGFYSAAFDKREPLWILVVHGWFALVGPSPGHLKLLTLVLSVIVVWLMIRMAAWIFGAAAGWVGGSIVALSGPLAFESSRGLRLELEMALLVAFLFVTFVWREDRPVDRQWILFAGALGGLLALTRSPYVSSAIPLIALGAFRRRRGTSTLRWLTAALAGVAVLTLCVFPHRYGFYKRYADPFWDTASYARAIANTEFAGTPGFPSRAEIAVDGGTGPPLTYAQYLFTLHTPMQVIRGTAVGLLELSRNMRVCRTDDGVMCAAGNAALQLCGLGGFLLALFPRHRRFVWIPVAFALLELPVAFLYERNILEQYRHTYQGFPLVVLGALLAFDWLAARFRIPVRQAAPCGV